MRDPVHRIKAQEPRAIPRTPFHPARFRPARGRLHERPTTEDDKNADSMKTESRYFQPRQIHDGQRAGRNPTPVRRRKCTVLEVGPEKMKVSDKENRQPL